MAIGDSNVILGAHERWEEADRLIFLVMSLVLRLILVILLTSILLGQLSHSLTVGSFVFAQKEG